MGRKPIYTTPEQKKAAAKRSRDRFKELHPDRVRESVQKETQRIAEARAKARLAKDKAIYQVYLEEAHKDEWGALSRTADRLSLTTFVVRGAINRLTKIE